MSLDTDSTTPSNDLSSVDASKLATTWERQEGDDAKKKAETTPEQVENGQDG